MHILAGAEFEVLEAMVHDSSLLLVDAIEVKWSDVFRPEFLEWPAMYSQVSDGQLQHKEPGASQ
jgi:hypothetical protein